MKLANLLNKQDKIVDKLLVETNRNTIARLWRKLRQVKLAISAKKVKSK